MSASISLASWLLLQTIAKKFGLDGVIAVLLGATGVANIVSCVLTRRLELRHPSA